MPEFIVVETIRRVYRVRAKDREDSLERVFYRSFVSGVEEVSSSTEYDLEPSAAQSTKDK